MKHKKGELPLHEIGGTNIDNDNQDSVESLSTSDGSQEVLDPSQSPTSLTDSNDGNEFRRMEEGDEDEDVEVGGLMTDETIHTRAGDEFLRPTNQASQQSVVLMLDDSRAENGSDHVFAASRFDSMRSKTKEENSDRSESSKSFDDTPNHIRRTLDYNESDSEIDDDPSVIEEADRVENEIRKNLCFITLTTFGLKLFNKLMECMFGNGNDLQQEVTAHVMEDITQTSISNSAGAVAGGAGGQGGAAAQAQ